MGLAHSPSIVTNGMVLCLDAANSKGYDKFENLVLQTSQIGNSSGTYLNGGIVGLNTTATTAPNGLNEATLVDNNGNVNQYVYSQQTGLTTNTTYTYSIHIKQGTKPDFQVTIDENSFGGKRYYVAFTYSNETVTSGITGGANDGVVVGSTATKLTNGWYRLSLTFTTSTNTVSTLVDMINRFGSTPGSNYVWGRQLEIGSSLTDYYATTTTAKNRGTTWTDLSRNGNNGTLVNGVGYNGSNFGSLVFDGTNDYVKFGSSIQPSNLTISIWIKPNTSILSGGYKAIVDKHSSWYLFLFDGVPRFFINGDANYVQSSITLTNNWFNVVGTYNQSSILMYVNGSLVGTTNYNVAISNNSNSIELMSRSVVEGKSNNYKSSGDVSQVSMYNRALTASEVQQNFNALRGRFGI